MTEIEYPPSVKKAFWACETELTRFLTLAVKGNVECAITVLRETLRIEPLYTRSHYNLAIR